MAASGNKSMASVHQRRGAPSQGQPKWWRAGRGAVLLKRDKGKQMGWCEMREQRIELSPRTVLNGGERGQKQGREAKKQFFFLFFFFSCIAVLVRDIVGQQLERVKKENKFPRKQKPTRTNTPTKQSNTHKSQTRERSREICKLGETGETSASLPSPSQVLFRQVAPPHVVHV